MGGKSSAEYQRQYYFERTKAKRENPDVRLAAKRRHFFHRFGITLDQFEEMIEAQDGRCAICRGEFVREKWNRHEPVLDHDHKCCPGEKTCGKCHRGVLHRSCNSGIGLLGDDPEVVRRAAEYLEAKCR